MRRRRDRPRPHLVPMRRPRQLRARRLRARRQARRTEPAPTMPSGPPPRRRCRTSGPVPAAPMRARSRRYPAPHRRGHRRAAPPTRSRACAPEPRLVATRKPNRPARRSAGSGSLSRPPACFRRKYRPKADGPAPPDWRGAGLVNRPRGAIPPRTHQDRCRKRTAPPDRRATAPDPVGQPFPRSRGFRGR